MTNRTSEADERVVAAVEAELHRLRNELHNGLCQRLLGLGLLVEVMFRSAARGEPVPLDRLTTLRTNIDEAMNETRVLLNSLNPSEAGAPGIALGAMLQALATERSAKFRCEFKSGKSVDVTDGGVALALFRIAQEACRIETKDPALRGVWMSLSHGPHRFVLEVRYRGRNLNAQNLRVNDLMHARARSIGGVITIRSAPTYTSLVCTVPCPKFRLPARKASNSSSG